MNNQEIISLITGVYMWFNQIADPKMDFHQSDLNRYFSPNFVMEMNDKIITTDYDSLYKHFEKFRQSGALMKVQFPFQEIVISEDKQKCIVRYNINKINPDQSGSNIKIIAIWHISKDNKLERMNEVVHFAYKH